MNKEMNNKNKFEGASVKNDMNGNDIFKHIDFNYSESLTKDCIVGFDNQPGKELDDEKERKIIEVKELVLNILGLENDDNAREAIFKSENDISRLCVAYQKLTEEYVSDRILLEGRLKHIIKRFLVEKGILNGRNMTEYALDVATEYIKSMCKKYQDFNIERIIDKEQWNILEMVNKLPNNTISEGEIFDITLLKHKHDVPKPEYLNAVYQLIEEDKSIVEKILGAGKKPFSLVHELVVSIALMCQLDKSKPKVIIKDEKIIKDLQEQFKDKKGKMICITKEITDRRKIYRDDISSRNIIIKRRELQNRALENNVSLKTQESLRVLMGSESFLNTLGLQNYTDEFYHIVLEDLIAKKSNNHEDAFNDKEVIKKLQELDKSL